MNELLAAAVLGLVQGLTEFLPVSSSGHLVLFQRWLPHTGDPIAFDLVLHLGTLVPVLGVFRRDLMLMAQDAVGGEGPFWQRPGVRLAMLVVLGSVPTAAIGLAFQDVFEQLFANPLSVGVAFGVTGLVLLSTRWVPDGSRGIAGMDWWRAALVGIAQGLAITPGISRSGSTIAAGMFLGIERGLAARYSFLLSVPAISGAFLLKARDFDPAQLELAPLAVGFTVAAVSGWGALVFLLRLVNAGDFSRFAIYLLPLSAISIAMGLAG